MNVARLPRAALPVLAALAALAVTALPANAAPALTAARAGEWWINALNVPAAWQTGTPAGKGVTVAVLSTGVDASHPDLTGTVTSGPDFSNTGRLPGGPYWGAEGTAVAGLIAGHRHGAGDTAGITGVAPKSRILSLQVTQEYNDPQDSDAAIMRQLPAAIAAGIRYAVGHGATVIALPLDPGMLGPTADADPATANGSAAEQAAVSFALAHGVLLVAPAGDNGAAGDAANYPAAYPGVVAVGATARDGQLSLFTSKDSYVTLTAPGSGITPDSPQPFGPLTDSATGLTVAAPDGGYASLASTDMAAGLTAGVAALIRSSYPWLTVPEVTQSLEQGSAVPAAAGQQAASVSARPAGWGHGELNAAAALAAAKVIAAAHPAAAPSAAPSSQAAGQPASSARRAQGLPSRSSTADPGRLLRTLLIDLVIAAGALIIALVALVSVIRLRRRARAAAHRAHPPQAGYAGTHTRRPRADQPAQPARSARPAWPDRPGRPGRSGQPAPPAFGSPAQSGQPTPLAFGSPAAGAATFGPGASGPGGPGLAAPGMAAPGTPARAGDRPNAPVRGVAGGTASRGTSGWTAGPAPGPAPSWSDSAWSTSAGPAWPETVAVPGWTAPSPGTGGHVQDSGYGYGPGPGPGAPASSDAPWPDAAPASSAWQIAAGDRPPWGPARPTATASPAPEPMPPWDQPGANFIPAPLAPEPPARPQSNSGPLYVWNPAPTTSPLRIPDEDQDE